MKKSNFYLSVRNKFVLSLAAGICWAVFSYGLAERWIDDIADMSNIWISLTVVYGIAIIPGFMNAFLVLSLLMDRRPRRKQPDIEQYPEITVLVAAYNKSESILGTLESIDRQQYPGKMRVIVINDGSTDDTAEKVYGAQKKYSWLEFLDLKQKLSEENYRVFDLICERTESLVASGLTPTRANDIVVDSLMLGYYSTYYLNTVKQSIKETE